MVKLFIIAHEPVGSTMAGPAIRCWELANTLSDSFDVTLAVPEISDLCATNFRLTTYQFSSPFSLETLANEADAILVSGYLLVACPGLARTGRPLIVDIYDPFPIENLGLHRSRSLAERTAISKSDFRVLSHLLQAGDFFICGSERQRNFWLGMLASCGRLNPRTYEDDPSFRRLIDVVPMGIAGEPPKASYPLKGLFPGIETGDFLVVWPGGLWDWLDPLTAVEAIHLLASEAPDVKLLFPGIRHPHPKRVGTMETPDAVLKRARDLDLLGRQVFCCDWTPYEERARYLVDADVALGLHFDGIEAELAVRARLLDCLWSGTRVISTRGDAIANAMAERGLAKLVPPRDPSAVAQAILEYRTEGEKQARLAEEFRRMAGEYRWSTISRPLVEFIREPRRAADRCERQTDSISRPNRSQDGASSEPYGFRRERSALSTLGEDLALADVIETLRVREAELEEAHDLLHRISQGKVMRLMDAFHSARRRLLP